MASMETSMKRIRSALVKAAVTSDGDATGNDRSGNDRGSPGSAR